nr:hypothetical protein [uncultured Brevundimonas sp.]
MDSPMRNACAMIGLAVLLLGCAADRGPSKPSVIGMISDRGAELERCVPLKTKVVFSCWWSGPDAPLTHCVNYAEDEPSCGLKAQVGAYLNRGAPGGGNAYERKSGTWQLISFYADSEGRVGVAAERMDGTRFLSHHDQSPPASGSTVPPVWPRWPRGLEFGPEQAAP